MPRWPIRFCTTSSVSMAALFSTSPRESRLASPDISFVHTWVPEECNKLMMENITKNLVDQDEYPAAQQVHERCVVSYRSRTS